MAEKTKAQLMIELSELKKQIITTEKVEVVQVQATEAATNIRTLYAAYVNAGFTDEQAFDLIKLIIKH